MGKARGFIIAFGPLLEQMLLALKHNNLFKCGGMVDMW